MGDQLAAQGGAAPTGTPGNALAVAALALGAGAAGAALLPVVGMVAAPLGAVAVALGATGIADAARRGRLGAAVTGTVLGALALLAGAAWAMAVFGWPWPLGGFTGPHHGPHMGMVRESAVLEAEPPRGPDAAPAPPQRDATPPPPPGPTSEPGPPGQEVRPSGHEPPTVEDGTGQATVTVGGRSLKLELASCDSEGPVVADGYLRGRGPDGRLAVHADGGRMVVAVDSDDVRHTLVGRRRSASTSGRGQEGVTFRATGEMTEVLTGDVVEVELEAECT